MRLTSICLAGMLTVAIGITSFAMGNPGYIADTQIGKPAPDFTLNTLKQKNVNMTKYRNGQKAIIFFWATWCPHCRVELKRISQIEDQFKQKGIKLILVSVGETPETVQEYILKNHYDFDVFLDEEQSLEEAYRIVGVPTLYFIDEAGKVQLTDHALPDDIEAPFRK